MKMVELGKICKIVSGSTPSRNTPEFWDGDIHWFTPKDLSGLASKYVYEAPEKITKEGFRSCSTNLIPSDSLLFSSRAPIGHLAINKLECCTNQGFKTMIPSENLNVEYLYYAIKRIVPQLQDMGNGATFKELSKSTFEKVEIPLPPLATQQKIAAILDAADAYRQKTKTLIAKYDQLAQSLFLDMFGGLKGKKENLDLYCELNPKKSEIANIERNIIVSFVPMANVSEKGELSLKEERELSDVWNGFTYFKEDDVVFAKITPCMENGKGAIMRNLKNGIGFGTTEFHVLRPIKNISNSTWLYFLTSNEKFRKEAEKNMTGSAGQKRVPIDFFRKYQVICPPITLQNQFAERIQLLEAQKQQAQSSLQKAEELFNSLLQKAFKGELG